jgi:hypothetical protein
MHSQTPIKDNMADNVSVHRPTPVIPYFTVCPLSRFFPNLITTWNVWPLSLRLPTSTIEMWLLLSGYSDYRLHYAVPKLTFVSWKIARFLLHIDTSDKRACNFCAAHATKEGLQRSVEQSLRDTI